MTTSLNLSENPTFSLLSTRSFCSEEQVSLHFRSLPNATKAHETGLVQVSLQTQIRINLARTIFATTEEIPLLSCRRSLPPPRRFIILLSSCLYPHFLLPSKADRCIPKVPFSFPVSRFLGFTSCFLSIGTYPLVRYNADSAVHQSQFLFRGLVSLICLRRICRRREENDRIRFDRSSAVFFSSFVLSTLLTYSLV